MKKQTKLTEQQVLHHFSAKRYIDNAQRLAKQVLYSSNAPEDVKELATGLVEDGDTIRPVIHKLWEQAKEVEES